MSILHSDLAWLIANPAKVIAFFLILCNLIVAVTPARYQTTKFFGVFLQVANRVSVLVHADLHGTLQWPLIAKEIVFGTSQAPVAVPAVVAAPVAAVPVAVVAPVAPTVPAAPAAPAVAANAPVAEPKSA